jgi:hypothetical protein
MTNKGLKRSVKLLLQVSKVGRSFFLVGSMKDHRILRDIKRYFFHLKSSFLHCIYVNFENKICIFFWFVFTPNYFAAFYLSFRENYVFRMTCTDTKLCHSLMKESGNE